jgi:hypothetical protein
LVRRVLAVILAVWEPLSLALFVAPVLATIATRGYATAAFLAARVVVAGIGVAAGLSLWRRDPHARALAAVALVLSTIASAITLTTTWLPTSIIPGDEWFWLVLVVGFNGGWMVYLRWFYR